MPRAATAALSRHSARRHAFVGQLLDRLGVLFEMLQAHAPQDMLSLGELDVVVSHDLDPVTPWIAEIEKPAWQNLHAHGVERGTCGLLVVDNEAEVAAIIRTLLPAFLEGEELIAQVDEGRIRAAAAQLEFK